LSIAAPGQLGWQSAKREGLPWRMRLASLEVQGRSPAPMRLDAQDMQGGRWVLVHPPVEVQDDVRRRHSRMRISRRGRGREERGGADGLQGRVELDMQRGMEAVGRADRLEVVLVPFELLVKW